LEILEKFAVSWQLGRVVNVLVFVNKVALHWVWLVLGRWIICVNNQPPRSAWPSIPPGGGVNQVLAHKAAVKVWQTVTHLSSNQWPDHEFSPWPLDRTSNVQCPIQCPN